MKTLTLATEQDAKDFSRAVFLKYREQELDRRGARELDCYADGTPLPVQVTTSYTGPPPPVDDKGVVTPADPKAVVVDVYVEALQGVRVTIDGGKQVVIDVSAATEAVAATKKAAVL